MFKKSHFTFVLVSGIMIIKTTITVQTQKSKLCLVHCFILEVRDKIDRTTVTKHVNFVVHTAKMQTF